MERRLFQVVLGVLSLIPLIGLAIAIGPGPAFFARDGGVIPVDVDNQWRYLSGVYASVTLGIWWTIPRVETRLAPLRIAALGVMLGGLGRLVSILHRGLPDERTMVAGLFLELGVVPLLMLWQGRLHRLHAVAHPSP
jgi:Domain of unknown function (DUF4345)